VQYLFGVKNWHLNPILFCPFADNNHYYKMWVRFINPCSLNQWIHSKSSEITRCIGTPFVVVNVQGSCRGWEMKSRPKGEGIFQMSFFVLFCFFFFFFFVFFFFCFFFFFFFFLFCDVTKNLIMHKKNEPNWSYTWDFQNLQFGKFRPFSFHAKSLHTSKCHFLGLKMAKR